MKVYLDTVGCRLNQSEIEMMARQFRAAGHEIVSLAQTADLAVVNTCAVTAEAASDSRAKIRHVARTGVQDVVATGCWATLQPTQAAALPNVSRVINNDRKDFLVSEILSLPEEAFALEPIARQPLPGLRRRTRAFIKAQDGCNNHCTFCVTTVARGQSSSRSASAVIADIQAALDGGTKEIVLTGVHLGSWGQELGIHLRNLVEAILHETDVPRLRLSSLEPWDLDASFFSLWDDPRLCRHLHLPLQSGCMATLKRMARKTTPASFRKLVAAARTAMPDAAITTDVIAGFPGETEAEFAESLDFFREMDFAGGHAFTYSPRPGTAAARMTGQLDPHIRKERNAIYRGVFDEAARSFQKNFIGRRMPVLWESTTLLDDRGWRMEGWTGNYLRVAATAPRPMWNEISPVLLQSFVGEGLAGQIAA
jgi:threonylcarbamoyladenosine tRNA methylthiotransferase MtaB